jgi:chromosome segregation ATPase
MKSNEGEARMTAPAATQRNSASVETEIRSLTSKRSPIESQQQKFSKRLLEIDAEIEQLKPRHFDGDTKAAPAIDKLEAEKRDLLLRVEGANAYISQFDEQIMPLRRELRALTEIDAAKDAAKESRRQRDAFERRLEELMDARIATYKTACRALYREAEFIHSEINLQPFEESEKNWRLGAVERAHNRLEAVALEIVNNKWKNSPDFRMGHLTTLVAKLPPENEKI